MESHCTLLSLLLWVAAEAASAMNLSNTPCGQRQVPPPARARVIGGRAAYRGQFPWSASIQHDDHHFCMGTIISETHILTAAHCFKNNEPMARFSVTVGGHRLDAKEQGRLNVKVAKKISHDGFKEGQFKNDVALLKLAKKLTWSRYIQPACLPGPGAEKFTGQRATLAGWGYTGEPFKGGSEPASLLWTQVPILDRPTCLQWYEDAGKKLPILPGQMCAGYKEGGRDSCKADSGGSLVVEVEAKAHVVGVVSAGIGCGRPSLPGLYTDVTEYSRWIARTVRDT